MSDYLLDVYAKLPLTICKGKGCTVWDSSGNAYLDFYAGHAVASTGHCHPAVVEAVKQQADKLLFYSNAVHSEVREEAAEAVVGMASGMEKVFFCNSGTEANEAAIKIARKKSGKPGIIAFKDSFHGRTFGSLSVTGIAKYQQPFKPLLAGVKHVEFGNADELRKAVDSETGTIIVEPVQGVAGVKTAPPEFFKQVKETCDDSGLVLVFDEVQTGFCRTGKNFFYEYCGFVPDVVSAAKGIASGLPMGAVLVKNEDCISQGDHGSTFGGGPIACAAAKATLQVMKEEKLADNAARIGDYLEKQIQGIRGPGLLKGIPVASGKDVQTKLLEKGVITGTALDPKILRITPPLVVSKNEADFFVNALKEVI